MAEARSPNYPLAVGLLLFVVAVVLVTMVVELGQTRSQLDTWAEEQAAVLDEVLGEVLGGVLADLEAVAAFIEESDPDVAAFQSYVNRIDGTDNALGIGYLVEVPDSRLDEYIAEQREAGREFELFTYDLGGQRLPLDRTGRDVYYLVEAFSAGALLNTLIVDAAAAEDLSAGLDVGSNLAWRDDIVAALARVSPRISEFITIEFGGLSLDRAFFASVPVLLADGTDGIVIAMMYEPVLVQSVHSSALNDVSWEIVPPGGVPVRVVSDDARLHPLQLPGGTTWTLALAPTADMRSEILGIPWWVSVVVAAVLSVLLAVALWLFVDRRRQTKETEQFRQAASDKDRFLASVSHELRTPLTVVTGAAHELRDNEESLAADDRSGLMGMLVDQAEELTGIVEDLLVAARDDIGSVAIHFSEIDLFTEAQRAMHAAGVPGAPSGDGARALADPQRVRQTLRNLLSNAVRYGGSEIRVVISAADEWVDVTIADNGNGVPRELRDLIFEPYQSAHLPDAAVRSVGLGLYISRNLAQAMGGELTYEYDGWSRFRLRLPSVRNDQALAQDRQPGTSSLPHVTTGG